MEVGGGVIAPVSVEMVAEFGLRVGRDLDAPALERLLAASRAVACFDRGIDALARRSRSRRGLERWLVEREHARDAVNAALDRLEALGLLDDAAFARGFAQAHLAKGQGERLVAAQLCRHGIARETADRILADLREEARDGDRDGADGTGRDLVPASLATAARRRARSLSSLAPKVAERRLVLWLVRRGHPVGTSRRVAREALQSAIGEV